MNVLHMLEGISHIEHIERMEDICLVGILHWMQCTCREPYKSDVFSLETVRMVHYSFA